jgi:hypothetical protein
LKKADMLRLMESWGIQTAKGISMTAQSLDNFFSNPYYAGILIDPWSGEEYPGNHVSMVSPEDFARVQILIARRNRSTPHQKERVEFPLRGLARCTSCHQYLTAALSKGRSNRYAYYHCGNVKCDSQPSYRAETVHEEFGSFLDEIAPKPEIVKNLERRLLKAMGKKQFDWKSQIERKNAGLARLEKQVHELIRMRSQSLITDDEFISMKSTISKRQLALTGIAIPERLNADQIQAAFGEVRLPLSRLRATWNSIPVGFHRRFNHMVLPVGFVIGETRTAELGPIFRALVEPDRTISHEVALTGENLNRLYQAIQAFAELFRSVEEEKKAA